MATRVLRPLKREFLCIPPECLTACKIWRGVENFHFPRCLILTDSFLIYWNLTCFVCVATCCVFINSFKKMPGVDFFYIEILLFTMRVSIALVQGLLMILWRDSFYSVKLGVYLFYIFVFSSIKQICNVLAARASFFFLKGKLKITAEYWKPVKYLESIWRLS